MAKKKEKKSESNTLWYGITENDFLNESDNLIDEEISEYDKEAMIYFSQNVNLLRHLPRLSDSLKPVERRGLCALYENNAVPNAKQKKSSRIVGDTMIRHPHSDASIYGTLAGMTQPWKNPVPLVEGIGNFGNDEHPNGYAHMRYTEMRMSKYAYECFFKDYDPDCIETVFNTSSDEEEPLSLPSRYPNILVNGGFGIATANSFCIPTYSIPDIVRLTKKLMNNPDAEGIYMMPDIPTGCDVVDNGTLREICDTGSGTLKMRSTISIEENPKRPNVWILRVHNLPWMVDISAIKSKLSELTKNGILPIKDVEDHSYPIVVKDPNGYKITRKVIKFDIIVAKAHDPNQIKFKLYKLTQLEKSISVNFKVVEDALSIGKLNMRDLILTWINTRREYKRRLLNKRIVKLNARISLLDILIILTDKDNLDKTIKVIKNNNEDQAVKALMNMKVIKINSYQAEKIVDMKLRMFSKDAHDKYLSERKKVAKELDECIAMTKSSKLIDEVISEELDGLLKYQTPRRSNIVEETSSVAIADTDHFITITKLGMIKKLPYNQNMIEKKKTPSLGVFKNQDYPLHGLVINNHDSLMMFDNFGRFSNIPVHEIENTEPSQFGSKVYDISKLNGEIVTALEFFAEDVNRFINEKMNSHVSIVTLTKNGYLKKTPIEEFTKTRNQKAIKAMKLREDDELVTGKVIIDSKKKGVHLLIYTEKGNFAYISSDQIAVQGKDASGLLSINLDPDDACKGICVIGDKDEYLMIITEKGNAKKCELDYLGKPGKRKVSSYLATLETNDKVRYVDGITSSSKITVCTRTTYQVLTADEIPTKARKAKCVKLIPVPLGNNIISVGISG